MAVSPSRGDSSGQNLRNAVNRACARSPVSGLSAGIEPSGGVLPGCPGGRGRFVRTIDIGSLSTMTPSRSKMTGSTSLVIRIALSKFLGSSSNRVLEFLAKNLLRALDADAPLPLGRFGRPTEEPRFVAYHDPKPGERESPRTAARHGGAPGQREQLSRCRRPRRGFRRSPGSAPGRRSG
jgi:hypothetical protein